MGDCARNSRDESGFLILGRGEITLRTLPVFTVTLGLPALRNEHPCLASPLIPQHPVFCENPWDKMDKTRVDTTPHSYVVLLMKHVPVEIGIHLILNTYR